jgi:hypothetical protein
MLQRTNATTNECYNERCYNERMLQRTNATTNDATTNECYNERMLQRTVFINKVRMIQRTQMLQQTRRNNIGRRSTRVRITCLAFPLRLERQSSSFLSFVRFSYQFSSVTCLFVRCIKVKLINFILLSHSYF